MKVIYEGSASRKHGEVRRRGPRHKREDAK